MFLVIPMNCRINILRQWEKQNGGRGITKVWEAAGADDNRLEWVSALRFEELNEFAAIPQWNVNTIAPKNLVVVAPNDAEGREIALHISEVNQLRHAIWKTGPVEIYPNLPLMFQEHELHDRDFDNILEYAHEHDFKEIIICELGSLLNGWSERARLK